MNIINNDRVTRIVSVILSVVFGVLLISLMVNAATTISTNVQTDGTLSVTGASTLTGLTSMIQASSTRFSVHDTAYFGGSATSTINSAGDLLVVGSTTLQNFTFTTATGTSATTTNFFSTVASSTRFAAASAILGNLTVKQGETTTLTTANSATSTLIVGCIQMYATSTATAVNLQFHASSTLANSTNGATAGLVVWKYGACPI